MKTNGIKAVTTDFLKPLKIHARLYAFDSQVWQFSMQKNGSKKNILATDRIEHIKKAAKAKCNGDTLNLNLNKH